MSSVNMSDYSYSQTSSATQPNFQPVVDKFVKTTKKVAEAILEPAAAATAKASVKSKKVHHHHYHGGWGYSPFFWPQHTTYIVAPNGYVSERDSGEKAVRWLVGFVGAAVAGVAFYAIGSFVKTYQKVEKRLRENVEFKNDLVGRLSTQPQELVNKLEGIATLRDKILHRMREDNIFKLAAVVTAAAASTIAVVGAVIGAPALMTAGTLLGLGLGAVVLVRAGMDNTERKQKRDAEALLKAINGLPAF